VLGAAYAILLETGLAGFSIENVALRSGVSRPTIYRWWQAEGCWRSRVFSMPLGRD